MNNQHLTDTLNLALKERPAILSLHDEDGILQRVLLPEGDKPLEHATLKFRTEIEAGGVMILWRSGNPVFSCTKADLPRLAA